eukprot:SAG31_NODE_36086_length_316_cov_1.423963_1_plen_104_part_11
MCQQLQQLPKLHAKRRPGGPKLRPKVNAGLAVSRGRGRQQLWQRRQKLPKKCEQPLEQPRRKHGHELRRKLKQQQRPQQLPKLHARRRPGGPKLRPKVNAGLAV